MKIRLSRAGRRFEVGQLSDGSVVRSNHGVLLLTNDRPNIDGVKYVRAVEIESGRVYLLVASSSVEQLDGSFHVWPVTGL